MNKLFVEKTESRVNDCCQTGFDACALVTACHDANRITRVTDINTPANTTITALLDAGQYWYNDAGQRVIKKEGTVETDYANQFTSVRYDTNPSNPAKVTTNNIYVGNERIVSALHLNNGTTTADAAYDYHTDHLGSTGYMTDGTGQLREHMEYTPWGETWMEQVDNSLMLNATIKMPNYMFTSKEQDATGLYYF